MTLSQKLDTSNNLFSATSTASVPSSNPHVAKVHCGSAGITSLYLSPEKKLLRGVQLTLLGLAAVGAFLLPDSACAYDGDILKDQVTAFDKFISSAGPRIGLGLVALVITVLGPLKIVGLCWGQAF